MSKFMVVFRVRVEGESPVEAVRQALEQVGAVLVDVWTEPDTLDEDPQLTQVRPDEWADDQP